jgi:uncharacterized protein (DUF2141 family)
MLKLLSPIFAAFVFFTSAMPSQGELNLEIANVKKEKGRIWVGIYESDEEFLDRDQARLVEMAVDHAGNVTIPINALAYGKEYALAIFHDENDNGEMDRNWLGLPTEPWAFSGEPKTRLRLPVFDEVKFTFNQEMCTQVVRLRKW